MTVLSSETIVRPLTPSIGAEISGVDLRNVGDPASVERLCALLHQWKVLFFRAQVLDQAELIAFGRLFGDLEMGHPIHTDTTSFPEIYRLDVRTSLAAIQNVADAVPPDDVSGAWHTDMTFSPTPPLMSVLNGVTIPAVGGDTVWTDLGAAYQGLSPPMRTMLRELRAVHRWRRAFERESPSSVRACVHPVVAVHPTSGEEVLWVNPLFTSHILDVNPDESTALLQLLFTHIKKQQFTVRFRWEPGSVAVWDNRATAHLALSTIDLASGTEHRVLDRVTVLGGHVQSPTGLSSSALVLEGESPS